MSFQVCYNILMKYVLITGANSYIGTQVESYLKQWPDLYKVTVLDMLNPSWTDFDFSVFDCVYHVAGIAHADNGKGGAEEQAKYKSVNTDLAVKTAEKAKASGVKQFIFMSSSIVYGESAPVGESKLITADTVSHPSGYYGQSKLDAEAGIKTLESDTFKVCILRPPMIYGPGCKGNYPKLSKMAQAFPCFPKVDNKRSMLYIDNLAEFVRLMIDNHESGIFWPQNSEYSNTSELVRLIAKAHNRTVYLVPGLTWAVRLAGHITDTANKAFGSLAYDMELSNYKEEYRLYSLEQSILETEK